MSKKKSHKFPATLYGHIEPDEGYVLVEPNKSDAVEDDGPTTIGVYKLIEIVSIEKKMVETRRKP